MSLTHAESFNILKQYIRILQKSSTSTRQLGVSFLSTYSLVPSPCSSAAAASAPSAASPAPAPDGGSPSSSGAPKAPAGASARAAPVAAVGPNTKNHIRKRSDFTHSAYTLRFVCTAVMYGRICE